MAINTHQDKPRQRGRWDKKISNYIGLDLVTYEYTTYVALDDVPKECTPVEYPDFWANIGMPGASIESKPSNNMVVYPETFGAVGDDVSDDTAAWEDALAVEADIHGMPGKTYRITKELYNIISDRNIIGNGCIINQVTPNTQALTIGCKSDNIFVQTNNVTIEGIKFIGSTSIDGKASYSVAVVGPKERYTKLNGCQSINFFNCKQEGFTGGLFCTGVNELEVRGCQFSDMKYHAHLNAGGYGVLLQSCFTYNVHHNRFIGRTNDRHAVYISANNSVPELTCKQGLVTHNIIDWSEVDPLGSTYQYGIAIRSPHNLKVNNNILLGCFGGIACQLENGLGENVDISDNTLDAIRSYNGVTFLRGSNNQNRIKNVTIRGNQINLVSPKSIGLEVGYCDVVTLGLNNVTSDEDRCSGMHISDCKDVMLGTNTLDLNENSYGVWFTTKQSSDVTISKNHISSKIVKYNRYKFSTTPVNLKWGFQRQFSLTSDGEGNIFHTNDEEFIVKKAYMSTSGLSVEFFDCVNTDDMNITIQNQCSDVHSVYRESSAGSSVITFRCRNVSGKELSGFTTPIKLTGGVVH